MASRAAAVKVLDVVKVTPEPPPSAPLCLPLTFFNTMWIKFPPVESIFLYRLPGLSPESFESHLFPRLRRSLSLALRHFLPLAGAITWDAGGAGILPVVLYAPGDAVSVTVAVSGDDFDRIAGDGARLASDSFAYLSRLSVSDSSATIVSLQITLFPDVGFCIGASAHHGFLDGRSQSMFIKVWAYTFRMIGDGEEGIELPIVLPEGLTPVFDRVRVENSDEVALEYWNNWSQLQRKFLNWNSNPNPRSLDLMPSFLDRKSERLRATFHLSKERINIMRNELIPQSKNPKYLSSFVVSLAHAAVCIVKAKRGKQLKGDDAVFQLMFTADFRSRLEPEPVPDNFFGNCVSPFEVLLKAAEATANGGRGTVYAAEKIIETVKVLEKGVMVGAKERLAVYLFPKRPEFAIGVAGSPRLELYGGDFGYGRPAKVEITSTARTGSISMMESKCGRGGVDVGVVLKKEEMDVFRPAFTGRAGKCNL